MFLFIDMNAYGLDVSIRQKKIKLTLSNYHLNMLSMVTVSSKIKLSIRFITAIH